MASKRAYRPKYLSETAQRDLDVMRAFAVGHSIVATSPGPAPVVWSGGGIHVSPPRKKIKRLSRLSYDFSFSLPLSKEDAELLKRIFHELLGGDFKEFDPDGNEWPDPPSHR